MPPPLPRAPPSRRQRSSSFPRPTRSHAYSCSRLTRQHVGEQSGLVTLTLTDLLTLKVVSESHVTWATSVPILVLLGLSVLSLSLSFSLLTAVLARQAAAAVIVGTCRPCETAATLPSARRRKSLRRPSTVGGGGGAYRGGGPPTACIVYVHYCIFEARI